MKDLKDYPKSSQDNFFSCFICFLEEFRILIFFRDLLTFIIRQNYKQNNLLLLLASQPDCHTFHCLCWQYRKQKNKNRQSITVVSFQFLDIPTALTFLGPKCANCATKTRAIFLFLFFFFCVKRVYK